MPGLRFSYAAKTERTRMQQPAKDNSRNLGLSSTTAAERLRVEGYNELPAPDRRGFLRIISEVVRQPMFALLIAGGIVYLLLGDRLEAFVLIVFASLSVTITIVQESR